MRKLFLLKKHNIYFDNASTTKKLKSVVNALHYYYSQLCGNVHRSNNQLTLIYEQSRDIIKNFIGANSRKEIIFTAGATDGINKIASNILWSKNDQILIDITNHNSNIFPWQVASQRYNLKMDFIYSYKDIESKVNCNTKIVCINYVSNITGQIFDKNIIKSIKKINKNTLIILDISQYVAHFPINVYQLECDILVFSSHKIYGPEGVGVLFIKQSCQEIIPILNTGGGTVSSIDNKTLIICEAPYKYEAGTQNISGVIALRQSIEFLQDSWEKIIKHERNLIKIAIKELIKIKQIQLVNKDPYVPIISFTVKDKSVFDLCELFNIYNISLRAGDCCAHLYVKFLNIEQVIRISFAPYNTVSELKAFIMTLSNIIKKC